MTFYLEKPLKEFCALYNLRNNDFSSLPMVKRKTSPAITQEKNIQQKSLIQPSSIKDDGIIPAMKERIVTNIQGHKTVRTNTFISNEQYLLQ